MLIRQFTYFAKSFQDLFKKSSSIFFFYETKVSKSALLRYISDCLYFNAIYLNEISGVLTKLGRRAEFGFLLRGRSTDTPDGMIGVG